MIPFNVEFQIFSTVPYLDPWTYWKILALNFQLFLQQAVAKVRQIVSFQEDMLKNCLFRNSSRKTNCLQSDGLQKSKFCYTLQYTV